MPTSLRTSTRRTVEHVWEERMGAQPGTLRAGGMSYVEWPDSTAVVILDIGGARLVAGQSEAVELLRGLTPGQLTDVEGIESALRSLWPELVGKALLGYVDGSSFTPADPSGRVRHVDRRAMEEVIAQCEVDDRDESGLAEMTSWFVVDEEGMPVAAAGFEEWSGAMAHCGVAVIAEHRGRGLGRSVASAAVGYALGEYGVVQWRSRDTNTASTRLGARLGFAQLGNQTAFDLHP